LRKTIRWIPLLFLFLTPTLLSAQKAGVEDNRASCRQFVQQFYAWYLPKIQKDHEDATYSRELKEKRSEFSPELLKRLDEDFDAASKNADEVVGLDFDPFLNTQDPGERYVAGKTTVTGNKCSVEVYGVLSGKKSVKPDVTPELLLENGHWIFVNFRYGPGKDENLLSVLETLKADRQKPLK
jgi:hypothetical protein